MLGSIVNFLSELGGLEIALLAVFAVQVVYCIFALPFAIYVLCAVNKSVKAKAKSNNNDLNEVASDNVDNKNDEIENTDDKQDTVENTAVEELVSENVEEPTVGEEDIAESVDDEQPTVLEEPEEVAVEDERSVGAPVIDNEEVAPIQEDENESVEESEPESEEDETPTDENVEENVVEEEPETVVEEPVSENVEEPTASEEDVAESVDDEQPTVLEEPEEVAVEDERSVGAPVIDNEEVAPIQEDENESVEESEPESVDEVVSEPENVVEEDEKTIDENVEENVVEEEPETVEEPVSEDMEEPTASEEEIAENVDDETNVDFENVDDVSDMPISDANEENLSEEPIAEETISEEPATDESNSTETEEQTNSEDKADISQFEPQVVDGFLFFNALRRSFLSKIIQANETTQNYYSEIKNKLLSYRKIHSRLSWGTESFRLGRALKAKMTVRGKTLCLFLALNPDDFNKNIYHQRNFGDRKKYAEVPLMLRVRSPLGLKRALNLIDIMLKDVALDKKFEHVVYSYPYETDDELIAKDLIRRIRAKRFLDVHADETVEEAVVRIVTDTQNEQIIESDDLSDNEEVNVDELEFAEINEDEDDEEVDIPQQIEEPNAVPEFVEDTQNDESAPTEFVPAVEEVEFAVEDERAVGAPVIDNGEVAPLFAEGNDEENEEIPEIAKVESETVPEFAGLEDADTAAPADLEENKNEIPDVIREVPPRASIPTRKGETDREESPEDAFLDPNELPLTEGEEDSGVAPDKLVSSEPKNKTENVVVPEFVNPEDISDAPESLPEAEKRVQSRIESAEDIKPEFAESEENDLPPDAFATLPENVSNEIKEETAPHSKKVTPRFEERPSTLPKGLYDDVPEEKKRVKNEDKQETKRVIPEGLTKEEQKLIEENQALLNELMENDEEIPEQVEIHEIVGTCTDTSDFNNFEMKLYNASNNIKYYYSEIKNTLLSYKGIKCKQSNAGDSFRQGNNLISRITLNGNKLRLHLALNPKEYSQNVYNHYSFAHLNAYKDVPFTLEVSKRSDLNVCVKLIQDAMASKFVIYMAKNREWVDYAGMYTKKED